MPLKRKKTKPAAKKAVKKAKPKARKRLRKPRLPVAPQNKEQPPVQHFEPRGFEIPAGYNDNRIVLMVRDPYWLYAYWEISSEPLILRVYDVSDWSFFDINVNGRINNWYINVGRPNTTFCIDIGYLTLEGIFICAARSNIVTTPRDAMSSVIDEEWMIPDWEMMYALSGGFGRGKGSMEIKEMIAKRQFFAPSSRISS